MKGLRLANDSLLKCKDLPVILFSPSLLLMHLRADFLSISFFYIRKNALGANILGNSPFSIKRKQKQSMSEIIIKVIRRIGFFLSDLNTHRYNIRKTSICCVRWAIPKLICHPLWDKIKPLLPPFPSLSACMYSVDAQTVPTLVPVIQRHGRSARSVRLCAGARDAG